MAEPITLTEAKNHLRGLNDDEDAYIETLITAARQYAENYQNRVYVEYATGTGENAVTVEAEAMPELEKCACLLMIGHWYENRSAVSSEKAMQEVPLGAINILNLRRNVPI